VKIQHLVKVETSTPSLSLGRRLALVGVGTDVRKIATTLCSQQDWDLLILDEIAQTPAFVGSDTLLVGICPDGVPQIERLEAVRRVAPLSRLIAVTAYPSLSLAVAAMRAGADDCVTVPLHPAELRWLMDDATSVSAMDTLPSLARIEWDYIARVLDAQGGNISRAAKTLGIQRSTLQRKLKKYPPHR
jgi:ActR/RegA family two-component response regulator